MSDVRKPAAKPTPAHVGAFYGYEQEPAHQPPALTRPADVFTTKAAADQPPDEDMTPEEIAQLERLYQKAINRIRKRLEGSAPPPETPYDTA